MRFLFRPYKAQYTFYKSRVEKLEVALVAYISGENQFPYPQLSDLIDDMYLIGNPQVQAAVLRYLNEKVVGRLYQHHPKVYALYKALDERITTLTKEDNCTENEEGISPSLV